MTGEPHLPPGAPPASTPAEAPPGGELAPELSRMRAFRRRMLGIGWKGWLRLAIVCILVGAVFEAGGINPFAPNFTIGGAITAIARGVTNLASWLITVGWRPLLTGAIVVLPLWLAWRLLSLPFRKQP